MDNLAFLLKPYTAEKLLTTVHKMIAGEAPGATIEALPAPEPTALAADKAA
jgi:hypothetical protein